MRHSELTRDSVDITSSRRSCKPVTKAILVRLLLLLHSLLVVWRTTTVLDNNLLWLLALANVLLVVDGIYSVVALGGHERKWFCPCFFFYLLSTLPGLWLLELRRFNLFDDILKNNNVTETTDELNEIDGITLPIKLDSDTWVQVLEQSLLFLLILGRWLLPRGSLTRDQLSQLLFVYIGSASDVMELFVIFEEPEIREDRTLTLAIFVVWTVSLLQFTLVLTATRNPKRVEAIEPESDGVFRKKQGPGCCGCKRLFELEVWSLLISILIMDGPFFAVRLYALIVHQLVAYGIIFFALKNLLMIALMCYRMVVICSKLHCEDDESNAVTPISRRRITSTDRGRMNTSSHEKRKKSKTGRKEKDGVTNHGFVGVGVTRSPTSFSQESEIGNGDIARRSPRYGLGAPDRERSPTYHYGDRGFGSYNNRVADSFTGSHYPYS